MLKGIDPLLSPDLLRILREMGHGDELAIVDANFPAMSTGPEVLRLDGIDCTRALDAVLSVFPLDTFVDESAWCMAVVGKPDAEEPIFDEFRQTILQHEGDAFQLFKLERFAFYDRAARCFAIVATGERRLYGNVILKKGVVRAAN